MRPDQKDVLEFHRAFGQEAPSHIALPSERTLILRRELILEEAREFGDEALEPQPSLPKLIKELVDILYVVHGTAVTMGVDLEPFWDEIHRSNMAKLGPDGKPVLRADGKVLKPPGWEAPNIENLLRMVDLSGNPVGELPKLIK